MRKPVKQWLKLVPKSLGFRKIFFFQDVKVAYLSDAILLGYDFPRDDYDFQFIYGYYMNIKWAEGNITFPESVKKQF